LLGVYSLLFGLGMIILMIATLADMLQNAIKMKKLKKKLFVVSGNSILDSLSSELKLVGIKIVI